MPSTLEEAQADLAPHAGTVETCVRGALEDYVTLYAKVRHKHSKRTEASIIHDLMVERFKDTFGSFDQTVQKEVAVYKKGNLTLVVVGGGKYRAKLKKLDRGLGTCNIQTNAVLSFVLQQISFAQVPDPTNLHVGYQIVDEASMTSAKVWITCPNGKRRNWEWELDVAKKAVEQKPAEVISIKPAAEAKKKRAKLKDSAKKQTPKTRRGDGGNGPSGR